MQSGLKFPVDTIYAFKGKQRARASSGLRTRTGTNRGRYACHEGCMNHLYICFPCQSTMASRLRDPFSKGWKIKNLTAWHGRRTAWHAERHAQGNTWKAEERFRSSFVGRSSRLSFWLATAFRTRDMALRRMVGKWEKCGSPWKHISKTSHSRLRKRRP